MSGKAISLPGDQLMDSKSPSFKLIQYSGVTDVVCLMLFVKP